MYLSQCQHLLELDKKLPDVLNGEIQPKAPERVEFADLCRRYRLATPPPPASTRRCSLSSPRSPKTWQPAIATTPPAPLLWPASARAEAAAIRTEKERTRLRNQALDWLRADLTAWDKQQQDDPKAGPEIQQTLQHWQADADLAGVRDADALAKLPESEREAWRKLWTDVDALSAKMDPAKKP